MSGLTQTLYDMRGAVKDFKPNAPADSITRSLNRRIGNVCKRRAWTDLTVIGNIHIPDAVTGGTVAVTPGSNVVIGTNTIWPVFDYINTAAPPSGKYSSVRQPGFNRIAANDMTGIKPGQWLVADPTGPNTEAVVVVWTDAISFIANFSKTHDQGFLIQASSLAGRQFRTDFPIFTVKAVIDPSTIWLDNPWAGPPQSNVAYQILGCYVQPDPFCWRLLFAYDPLQGIALDVDEISYQSILIGDPQLTASEDPSIVCPMPPAAGEVAQFFVYPPESSERSITVIYAKTWPKLIADEDRGPGFIDNTVFINGAIADVLRQKVMTERQKEDPYYNPELAREYEGYFESAVEAADEADQALSPDRLSDYFIKVTGSLSLPYERTHPGWPTDFNYWR